MPSFYAASVDTFLADDADRIIGVLITAVGQAGFSEYRNTQTATWLTQIEILGSLFTEALNENCSIGKWQILLEYPIPRRQKRIDAVLLANDIIYVIEFKVGAKKYDSSARMQAEDYALDLRDFHVQSRGRVIVPILVATDAPSQPLQNDVSVDNVLPTKLANKDTVGRVITHLYDLFHDPNAPPLDTLAWDHSAYQPVPTIIEAAELLYSGQSVREISSSHAGLTNLTSTCDRLIEVIRWAQQNHSKAICFVTGIPGAGKTLTGLNAVHNPDIREDNRPAAAFLSGNGPLVAIVREALAHDEKTRKGTSLKQARHNVSTFIQNVHAFLDHSLQQHDTPPYEHVVVFDEAQRAWNAEKQMKKYHRSASEPSMMLSVMDRHLDWAVIIALVGGGQEIHNGEAGLAEWGKALSNTFRHWQILASPEVISGGISLAGHQLFENNVPSGLDIVTDTLLHLAVSIRSYKAEAVVHWVNAVLEGRVNEAAEIARTISDFPMALTRSLDQAREWLRIHTRGLRRCGLVASSEAKRLRPYGIEVTSQFRRGISYEQWFLNGVDDIRSSFQLEVAATEFDCQGLELDWVGICWDGDLIFDASRQKWIARRLSGSDWRIVRNPQNQQFWLNKYRVLMTRAREGFVIWVPPGDPSDKTQAPDKLDAIAAYLRQCGLVEI